MIFDVFLNVFEVQVSSSCGRVSMIQVRHKKRMGTEGLSFYHTNLLYSLNQMLAVIELSQHLILPSKTIRPIIPRDARCVGNVKIMWSAVRSLAPHSHFVEGARPHLCMDETKRPTPVRRREFDSSCSSQTHSNRSCADSRNVDTERCILSEYSVSHVKLIHWAARMPNSDKLCNSFRATETKMRLDFSLS